MAVTTVTSHVSVATAAKAAYRLMPLRHA